MPPAQSRIWQHLTEGPHGSPMGAEGGMGWEGNGSVPGAVSDTTQNYVSFPPHRGKEDAAV